MRKFQFKIFFIINLIVAIEFINISCALASVPLKNPQEIFLSVYLNGENLNQVTKFLQIRNNQLYISRENLIQWDLDMTLEKLEKNKIIYHNQYYYPLSAFTHASYHIDPKQMAIYLNFKPETFTTHDFNTSHHTSPVPVKPGFGAFMNYDILAQKYTDASSTNGLFTPGIFTPEGTITSSFLAQRTQDENMNTQHMIRLNTLWETDYPDKMKSLKIGDTYSTPGTWGNSIGFGGIQFGTNFATQPDFVTFPLPSTRGIAVVPSTVDLYINNVLSNNKTLPTGPFTINAIPVVTGSGTVNIVTTDVLGHQQIVNLPYYASDELLKPGLHNYSLEAGFIRKNFGFDSNNYGQFAAVGTDNIGITEKLTAQWHTELQKDQQNFGIGENYLINHIGVFSSAAAISHNSNHKLGQTLLLGFQRQSFDGISYGIRLQTTTEGFKQLGLEENQHAPALTSQLFLGIPLRYGASLGASYIQQNNRDSEHIGLISFSYSQPFFKKWSLSLSTVTTVRGPNNKSVFLTLTRALDNQTTLNIGGNKQSDSNQGTLQIDRNLPLGSGWGYNLYGSQNDTTDYQATITGQNDIGTYSAGVARQQNVRGYQAEAKGSIALLDNHVYLARTLGNSFGVVKIPRHSQVRIYEHNQEIGRTDSKGDAFIPDLLPYQENPIKIAQSDLSLDTSIKSTEINAVPYNNSGLVIEFPVKNTYSALVTLIQSSGKPVPAGALIDNKDTVANEGQAYLTSLNIGENNYTAVWDDQHCSFSIAYTKTQDPLPDLGVIRCV